MAADQPLAKRPRMHGWHRYGPGPFDVAYGYLDEVDMDEDEDKDEHPGKSKQTKDPSPTSSHVGGGGSSSSSVLPVHLLSAAHADVSPIAHEATKLQSKHADAVAERTLSEAFFGDSALDRERMERNKLQPPQATTVTMDWL